jgi:hypothetical protein
VTVRISIPSQPASAGWPDLADFPKDHLLTILIVIATIVVAIAAAALLARPRRRWRGPVYSFPKRLSAGEILRALGKAPALQTAILKYIVDGYFEGVDPAGVAAHFRIKKSEAAKHLTALHRQGLLYIKRNAGGAANFYLIESVMSRIGEPRFFDLIGLPSFA